MMVLMAKATSNDEKTMDVANDITTIRLRRSTKQRLADLGSYDDDMDDIVNRVVDKYVALVDEGEET